MNKVSLYIFIILNLTNLNAQLDKKTMAVLNFKGIGINTLEAVTLTDIFNAEITKTNISSLIDRSEVKVSLKNQGLDQSSCLSAECISKVGAALEVELIMTGVINKNNESFNLEIKIFEVSKAMKPLLVTSLVNGEVVIRKKLKEVKMSPLKEKTVSYIGSTDGFINEIEIMAWELMGLNPPEIKVEKQKNIAQVLIVNNNNQYERVIRSALAPGFGQRYAGDKLWGWVWLGSEVVIGTLAYLEFSDYKTSLNNYNKYQQQYVESKHPDTITFLKIKSQESRNNMISRDKGMTNLLYAFAGVWTLNVMHAYFLTPENLSEAKNTNYFDLVYNNFLNQPEIRFSISLN